MAVKVYESGSDDPREYADGTGLDVRDNHLIVTTGQKISPTPQDRIAVFAPGKWTRGENAKQL